MKKILLPFMVPTMVGLSTLGLTACSSDQPPVTEAKAETTSTFEQVYAGITADEIVGPLKTLSSDEFEGRLPTTPGEKKTLDYCWKYYYTARPH